MWIFDALGINVFITIQDIIWLGLIIFMSILIVFALCLDKVESKVRKYRKRS